MNTVVVKGETRKGTGKKATKAVRNNGQIPCILYGGGDRIAFSTNFKEVKSLIFTPDFKIAHIEIDGSSHPCILKNVQFHPVSEEIEHVDFLRLIPGKPIKVEVPVRFRGTSPGVKEGGKLIQSLRRIKIKTTPEHLVDELNLNISELKLGFAIRVRDIEVPEGVEILNASSIPVASVEVPRALRSATAGEEAETEEVV